MTGGPEITIPCTECQAGQMHKHYLTYFTWLGDDLITVPNFPAWICDVCGRRLYDNQALIRLNLLLTPNAGKATPKRRTTRRRGGSNKSAGLHS